MASMRNLTPRAGEVMIQALRDLLRAPSPLAPLAFGVANGFLPCPLVYAFLARAAASGGPVPGMATMLAFGLGTFPAMLLMGGLGGWLWRKLTSAGRPALESASGGNAGIVVIRGGSWQRHVTTAAGAFIVLLGLITLARGVLPMHVHGHLI